MSIIGIIIMVTLILVIKTLKNLSEVGYAVEHPTWE